MPKKKKTLKQKMQTDQRRQSDSKIAVSSKSSGHTMASEHEERPAASSSGTFSLSADYRTHKEPVAPRATHDSTIAIATNEYSYLGKDLLKTGFLTIIIVLAELVIKFVFEGR